MLCHPIYRTMYQLEFISGKDYNIRHSVTYDIKKGVLVSSVTRVEKYVQSTVIELLICH